MQYIPYSVYNSDPNPSVNFPKASHTIKLYNNDFKNGTVRIKSSTNVLFAEDVVFDPIGFNQENQTYEPHKSANASEYTDKAYHLGFFAAITVEANNVDIDLNEKKLSQSDMHRLHQRFIALIELGSQPFIVGQGPGNFGTSALFPTNVTIKNGILGSNAHHGIHGNNNDSITIQNIIFEDFEVAGIALNAATNCNISNCHLRMNNSTVFVNALFSAAIFASRFCHKILANNAINNYSRTQISDALAKLDELITYVITYNCSEKLKFMPGFQLMAEASDLFFNKNLDIDGNVYGIILHDKGVAIGPFLTALPSPFKTSNNAISNIVIENISATVDEVIGLSTTANINGYGTGPFNDFTANVIDFELIVNNQQQYKGNVLSNVQMLIADLLNVNSPNKDQAIITMKTNNEIGIMNIPGFISDWAKNKTKITDVITQNNLKKCFFVDSMNHRNKGVIGIRVSGASNTTINKIYIKNVTNNGLNTKYVDINNPYTGHNTYGIHASACSNITLNTISVNNCVSKNGTVYGIHIENTTGYSITGQTGNAPNLVSVVNST